MVASVLETLGLEEFIASDQESYVDIASSLCDEPRRLAELRTELRGLMERSPLCDERAYTRMFEAACREVLSA
jgi:predicted O-linked N-acetylglucosamine transferase (SPINDLY family)